MTASIIRTVSYSINAFIKLSIGDFEFLKRCGYAAVVGCLVYLIRSKIIRKKINILNKHSLFSDRIFRTNFNKIIKFLEFIVNKVKIFKK